jgi:hypothetical protein
MSVAWICIARKKRVTFVCGVRLDRARGFRVVVTGSGVDMLAE